MPDLPSFFIEGRWVQTRPAENLGGVGQRELAEFNDASNRKQIVRKILLRRKDWRYPGFSPNETPVRLVRRPAPEGLASLVVPLVEPRNSFEKIAADKEVPSDIFEQELTGHEPLGDILAAALKATDWRGFWEVLAAAGNTLETYGSTARAADGKLLLQCPESLVVKAEGESRVVRLLDAELWPEGQIPAASPPAAFFQERFGVRAVECSLTEFEPLHRRALLRFARKQTESLASQGKVAAPMQGELLRWFGEQDSAPANLGLKDFREKCRLASEKAPVAPIGKIDRPPDRPVEPDKRKKETRNDVPKGTSTTDPNTNKGPLTDFERPKPVVSPDSDAPALRRRLKWFQTSTALFLVLALAAGGLAVYYAVQGDKEKVNEDQLVAASRTGDEMSPYQPAAWYIIFPSKGNPEDKIKGALKEVFTDAAFEISSDKSRTEAKSNELRRGLQGLDAAALGQLFARLYAKKVRFVGYNPALAVNLADIVQKGGVYEYPAAPAADPSKAPFGPAHGSLLQPGAIEHVSRFDPELSDADRKQLAGLRNAIAGCAALDDALNAVGGRKAFLVRGSPVSAAYEKSHRALLGRQQKPVFIFRPALAFYDAVDPEGPTGGGILGSNRLKLERRSCFFRQVGQNDRANVNWAEIDPPEKKALRWQSFKAGEEILWAQVQLPRDGLPPLTSATFDLAVPVGDEKQFVVFRNQFIIFGKTDLEVSKRADAYLKQRLGLDPAAVSGAYSPVTRDGQSSATLSYLGVADAIKNNPPKDAPDVKILPADEFSTERQKENDAVK